MGKKYRFFFHYRKQTSGMTVHFRGQCIPVHDVECRVKCETKRKKTQPHLVLQGYCSDVLVEDEKAIII
jgi:hypothetical protein